MAEETHTDPTSRWLIFFFVCFIIVMMGIGGWAMLNYHCNAPEAAPVKSGH